MALSQVHGTVFLALAVLFILLLRQLSWLIVRLLCRAAFWMPRQVAGSRVWARTSSLHGALLRRFPVAYGFVSSRLDPRAFSGLPLTLFVTGACYLAFLLAGLIEEVVEAKEIVSFDKAVNALFAPYRTSALVGLFAWITALGDTATLVGVTLVASGLLWAFRHPPFVVPLWVTILGAHATTWLGKFGFDRDRPDFATTISALSPSFPSAHATGSMAVYGFVAYTIARELPNLRDRFEVTFWTVVAIALIGFSRIFLSVHYASDVAAGFLVGGFWLLVGFTISEHLRERGKPA